MAYETLIDDAITFVKKEMAGQDGSHDFKHIERVYKVAMTLAKEEAFSEDEIAVVTLSALLHDVGDWKYTGSETSGVEMTREFLKGTSFPEKLQEQVLWIIERVSFHHEIENRAPEKNTDTHRLLAIVQDADRLDGIGALGVARAFTFGGSKKRPLYDEMSLKTTEAPLPDKSKYVSKPSDSTLYHFYEKLFHIKDMMKTKAGRRMAEERHKFLHAFVNRMKDEIAGQA